MAHAAPSVASRTAHKIGRTKIQLKIRSRRLAEAMLELARSPNDAAAMGRVGRSRVQADFTRDAVARKVKATLADSYGL
jgi:hypothetical protein